MPDRPAIVISRRARVVIGLLLVAIIGLVLALVVIRIVSGPPGDVAGGILPTPPSVPDGAEVLLAVGDIGSCDGTHDADVARLAASLPGEIALLGDIAYPNGSTANFADCFAPDWGPLRSRLRPVPGNHEYRTPDASAYYAFFGTDAGPPGQGWYSYDIGDWHVVALNSNCSSVGGCDAGSPQMAWLARDLADHPSDCLLAYWHHPRWSSGRHGSTAVVDPLWQALRAAGVDLVLNGHEHSYERLSADGVREFVVGTGGRSTYTFDDEALPASEARHSGSYGLLWLALGDGTYSWEYLVVGGSPFTDAGTGSCSGA